MGLHNYTVNVQNSLEAKGGKRELTALELTQVVHGFTNAERCDIVAAAIIAQRQFDALQV